MYLKIDQYFLYFQAVRIPEEYINEGPVNTNPAENIAYNNDPTYGLYGKMILEMFHMFKSLHFIF